MARLKASGTKAPSDNIMSSAIIARAASSDKPAWFWPGLAAITVIYVTMALSHIAELPLLDPDEPRYASAGRTMSRGGSWLVPQFNNEPRINKPPLFYWLVALSDKLAGGATETSSRAPSVLMGLLMLWGTVWLGVRVFGRATGLLAGVVLLATPLSLALSRCCITDMTLSAFFSGAFGFFLLSLTQRQSGEKMGWIAAFFLGLAVLTKATPALAALLAVVIFLALELPISARPRAARVIPWMLLAATILSFAALQADGMSRRQAFAAHALKVQEKTAPVQKLDKSDSDDEDPSDAPPRNNWAKLDDSLNKAALFLAFCVVALLLWMAVLSQRASPTLPRMWAVGLVGALMMGLWWYGVLIYDQGWARFKALLHFEIKQRIAGAVHREGFHYYLSMLPAVIFPWSIGLPAALRRAWPKGGGRDENPQRRSDTFLLAWLLGVVFFFSIPGAKLSTYLLPSMPAVALLMARYFMTFSEFNIWRNVTRNLAILVPALLIPAVALLPIYARYLPKDLPEFVHENPLMLWSIAGVLAIVLPGLWLAAIYGRARSAAVALAATCLLLIYVSLPYATEKLKHRSTRDACLAVKETLSSCKRIESLGVAVESLSYYLDRRVETVHWRPIEDKAHPEKLLFDILGKDEPAAIFVDKRFYPRLLGKTNDLRTQSPEEVRRNIPPELEFVYSDHSMLIVRNKIDAK